MSGGGSGLYGYAGGTGPSQLWTSEPVIVANIVGGAALPDRVETDLRLEMPDSRLRVKLSLIFVRRVNEPGVNVITLDATVYVGEEEKDRSGLTGGRILCTDVLRDAAGAVVHQSAPLAIPEDVDLSGWSQEFVSAADSCLVRFATNKGTLETAGPSGVWVAQARFQPDGQRLHDEDWSRVIRNCGLTLIGQPINL